MTPVTGGCFPSPDGRRGRYSGAKLEETVTCQANEAAPKGRFVYGPCFNHFKVKIKLS